MERIEYKIKNLGKFKIIELEIYHTYKFDHNIYKNRWK